MFCGEAAPWGVLAGITTQQLRKRSLDGGLAVARALLRSASCASATVRAEPEPPMF